MITPKEHKECWYVCDKTDEKIFFSAEFDTWVHKSCAEKALEEDPKDMEAKILLDEVMWLLGDD